MSAPRSLRGLNRGRAGSHLVLMLGVLVFAFPFYWLIVMATSSTADIYTSPPRLIPGLQFFTNFHKVLNESSFTKAFENSLWLTSVITLIQLFFTALAGYVFAKKQFPGRNVLFAFLLAALIVPTGVSIVPSYQIYAKLGWINTFYPLIIPGAVTAFGVFWMRQAAEASVSNEIVDAARIDGAGFMRSFWNVALPAMRPALVAFGIFQIMWAWNDYLWPLLVLGSPKKYTLPVVLDQLLEAHGSVDYSAVMAATFVATIPLVVVFFALRKRILENVSAGALKG